MGQSAAATVLVSAARWIRANVAPWLAPALVIGVIAGRRWHQLGTPPSGLDGGQWLALGRGFGGPGRSSEGAYPPLVPLLVEGLRSLVGPMDGLRWVAIGSLAAVMAAVYGAARDGLGPGLALPATATIGMASASTEPLAFGGYPQHVSFAALLVAATGLARFMGDGRGRDLGIWVLGSLVAALAHHVYFPLTLAVGGTVWLLSVGGAPWRGVYRAVVPVVGAAPALVAFLPTVLGFRKAGYAPPLETGRLDLLDAARYGTREAPWLWGAIVVGGTVAVALTPRDRSSPTWRVASALMVVALPLFLLFGEVRVLPPLLTGGLLGALLGLRRLGRRCRQHRLALAPLGLAVGLPVVLWSPADSVAGEYVRYYRVVDASLVATARVLEGAEGPVVVRHDRRGWPIGWWFEGLTETPIVVGSDERWLGFSDERARAELAGRFFDAPLTAPEVTALARENGIDLVVFRKWEWIGWQRWLEEPGTPIAVVHDDDRFMVLDVASAGAAATAPEAPPPDLGDGPGGSAPRRENGRHPGP